MSRIAAYLFRTFAVVVAAVVIDCVVALIRDFRSPPARVVDRVTGDQVVEPRPLSDHIQMSLVWSTVTGSRVLCRSPLFLDYLKNLTIRTGTKMDEPRSRERIDSFIKDNGVDVGDLDRAPTEFATLNEFFSRALRPDARPLAAPTNPRIAVVPADCRLRCLAHADEDSLVDVKAHRHQIAGLLGIHGATSTAEQQRAQARISDFYERNTGTGFATAVCRLAPGDYHRFHWPVDADYEPAKLLEIEGVYHSVSPTAVRSAVDVLGVNRRTTILVDSDEFGKVAIVLVGALKVGSIELTSSAGRVRRGDELGLFRYGGSTVVLVFSRRAIDFEVDLLTASAAGFETRVRMGDSLGASHS